MKEYRLPIYDSLYIKHSREKKLIKPLSVFDLIIETHNFMQSFQKTFEEEKTFETIVFLDKSARPLSHVFNKLFRSYYPDNRIKRPKILFMDFNPISSKAADESIRTTYSGTITPNSSVLVVDEYLFSGMALDRIMSRLKKIFPDSLFISKVVYKDMPVWYGDINMLGVRDRTLEDFVKITFQQVNKRLGTKYKFANYNSIPDEIKLILQTEMDKLLGQGEVLLLNLRVDPYRDKKLARTKFGNVPYTQRNERNPKKIKQAFRRELDLVASAVLDYRNEQF